MYQVMVCNQAKEVGEMEQMYVMLTVTARLVVENIRGTTSEMKGTNELSDDMSYLNVIFNTIDTIDLTQYQAEVVCWFAY